MLQREDGGALPTVQMLDDSLLVDVLLLIYMYFVELQ